MCTGVFGEKAISKGLKIHHKVGDNLERGLKAFFHRKISFLKGLLIQCRFELDTKTPQRLAKITFSIPDWFPNSALLHTYLLSGCDSISGYSHMHSDHKYSKYQ